MLHPIPGGAAAKQFVTHHNALHQEMFLRIAPELYLMIELDRLAGEPLDVLVNGTLIAHGEVVVVNEKFGIRLTDVISPSERIKKLR
jgi:hypothetical protein